MRPGVDALPVPTNFLAFALLSLGIVLTPGPNMIYALAG